MYVWDWKKESLYCLLGSIINRQSAVIIFMRVFFSLSVFVWGWWFKGGGDVSVALGSLYDKVISL